MTALGPLVADADGVRFAAAAGSGCRFTADGVELWDADTPRRTIPWRHVRGVSVSAPGRFRRLRALPAFALTLLLQQDVGGVEDRHLTVHIDTDRWSNGPDVDLGNARPYRRRDLRRLDALLREMPLRALVDARIVADRMRAGV